MSNTSEDLREHLHDINDRINSLGNNGPHDDNPTSPEWRDLWAEKRCTQQGLEFCAQISSEIERLEPGLQGAAGEMDAPIAREYWKHGVQDTKSSIRAMESKFQNHKEDIEQQMQAMPSYQTQVATELEDLQKSKDGLENCLKVVSQAEEQANVFENIKLSESSVNITVSTVGKSVKTRNVTLSDGSFNLGGQLGSVELAALFQGLGLAGKATSRATSAAWTDADASSAGLSRSERGHNRGNAVEQSAEMSRVTTANGKAPGEWEPSTEEESPAPEVVMCESGTASSSV